jgi:hypothetical protein
MDLRRDVAPRFAQLTSSVRPMAHHSAAETVWRWQQHSPTSSPLRTESITPYAQPVNRTQVNPACAGAADGSAGWARCACAWQPAKRPTAREMQTVAPTRSATLPAIKTNLAVCFKSQCNSPARRLRHVTPAGSCRQNHWSRREAHSPSTRGCL